jgi:sterol desaturase/sphingolipid hydroxylase (fatty acid hydroxylase superfamily)
VVPVFSAEQTVIALGGFVGLLLLESVRPFRPQVDSRRRRYFINFFITGSNALILNLLLSGLIIAAYKNFDLHQWGLLHRLGIGAWWNVLFAVIFLDGVTYWWHRAYHGVGVMWRMHRVHHSDLDLDVTSSGRFHITEMVLSALFRIGVVWIFGATLAGVVVFEIILNLFNQLEHSNLQIPDPLETGLRSVFVTPDMHRIHHSEVAAHTNSNYGTIFSCWDRLFGTYVFGPDQRGLKMGLPEYPQREDVTLGKVLAMPLGQSCK